MKTLHFMMLQKVPVKGRITLPPEILKKIDAGEKAIEITIKDANSVFWSKKRHVVVFIEYSVGLNK